MSGQNNLSKFQLIYHRLIHSHFEILNLELGSSVEELIKTKKASLSIKINVSKYKNDLGFEHLCYCGMMLEGKMKSSGKIIFKISQTMEGLFKIIKEDDKKPITDEEIEFFKYQAPAIILGFLRVSTHSFLSLAGLGYISIPLINMVQVVKDIEANKKNKES